MTDEKAESKSCKMSVAVFLWGFTNGVLVTWLALGLLA